MLALVGGACGSEFAEGDRVTVALGGEVAPESEHVCRGGQAEVGEFGELAEADAFSDQPPCVAGYGQSRQTIVRREAPVQRAGAFGCLGGVLGDVGSDLGVGEFAAGGDRADVVLGAPSECAGWVGRCGRGGDAGCLERSGDGGAELGDGGPGGRRCGGSVWAVQPDDGVEVDDTATLILGDLGVGDAGLCPEVFDDEPDLSGQDTVQSDGEANAIVPVRGR